MNNRAVNKEDFTQNVALYMSSCGSITARQPSEYWDNHANYVRVSESIDVTFTPLSDEVVLKSRVDSIDAQITQTRAKMTLRIADLTDQKNRLLAIEDKSDCNDGERIDGREHE